MDDNIYQNLAEELVKAEEEGIPTDPFTKRDFKMEVSDAYEVQRKVIEIKKDKGQEIVGRKIGLTSRAMQEKLGVNEPDYGVIMDKLINSEFRPVDSSELIQPKIEAEIAFYLDGQLRGPGATIGDVARVTGGVGPCIEIIDSRIKDWDIRIQDTISDNASIGRVILGGPIKSLSKINPKNIGLVVEKNGLLESTAAGAAVMGNPMNSVAWLANKLAEFGDYIEGGRVVISGSLVSAVELEEGDTIQASFDGLGSVSLTYE